MARYVAFLRAVNVGGTGKLPMADLRRMCGEIGFSQVQTYIASGNVSFTSNESKHAVKEALEDKLQAYAGRGRREIYVYYKSGIGRSKLKIPATKDGTARNMNTIAKMVELAECKSSK